MKNKKEYPLYAEGYEINSQNLEKIRHLSDRHEDISDWHAEFDRCKKEIILSLSLRDSYCLLARSASQSLYENRKAGLDLPLISLPSMELIQAVFLSIKNVSNKVPVSPNSFLKIWKNTELLSSAFLKKQSEKNSEDQDLLDIFSHRVKVHTTNYRFSFDADNCISIVKRIAEKFDIKTSNKFHLEERYSSLINLVSRIDIRLREHYENVRLISECDNIDDIDQLFQFFASKCPNASRIWLRANVRSRPLEECRYIAFQLAEISHEWIYTFDNNELTDFEKDILDQISMSEGSLIDFNFDHIFMDNPVWGKPFILKSDGSFFTALPQAPLAFPFHIIDNIFRSSDKERALISKCRSDVLEELVFETVEEALPSAKVYQNVVWTDPESGNVYENDILALLENQIFIFEAKSGKIADAAKRGAKKRLEHSLQKIFIEPAQQSERLQSYLNNNSKDFFLYEKSTNKKIDINLNRPKVVYRFSVTMENFASLTSVRRHFEEMGLIENNSPWAPALSINELRMISKFLDSEISFGHYLSRRFSIETLIDYMGDEQDLLSMYLTNGFSILGDNPEPVPIMFLASDEKVRTEKTPDLNRKRSERIGIDLPPRWRMVVDEIYKNTSGVATHKFDIIFTLINQPRHLLIHLQKRIIKWRSGAGGITKTGEYSKYIVGKRQFILMLSIIDHTDFRGPSDVADLCRSMAINACEDFFGISDCVVLTLSKKSKRKTFDGVHFFRLLPGDYLKDGPLL